MKTTRALQVVLSLAFGAALPTIGALTYYSFTGDPTVRPLGISKQALDRFIPSSGAELEIRVILNWGEQNRLRQNQDEVIALIGRNLDSYDVDYSFQFLPVPGPEVSLYYQVRGSRIGPYAIARAAEGIPAAISALRRNAVAEGVAD